MSEARFSLAKDLLQGAGLGVMASGGGCRRPEHALHDQMAKAEAHKKALLVAYKGVFLRVCVLQHHRALAKIGPDQQMKTPRPPRVPHPIVLRGITHGRAQGGEI